MYLRKWRLLRSLFSDLLIPHCRKKFRVTRDQSLSQELRVLGGASSLDRTSSHCRATHTPPTHSDWDSIRGRFTSRARVCGWEETRTSRENPRRHGENLQTHTDSDPGQKSVSVSHQPYNKMMLDKTMLFEDLLYKYLGLGLRYTQRGVSRVGIGGGWCQRATGSEDSLRGLKTIDTIYTVITIFQVLLEEFLRY